MKYSSTSPGVTTIFWREARAVRQPRRLLHRFANLIAFLLLLTIVALVCLSLSSPIQKATASNRRHVVLVLDAGMSMQAPAGVAGRTRFDVAQRAAADHLAEFSDSDRVSVIVADPLPRAVHRFDQPPAGARRGLQVPY